MKNRYLKVANFSEAKFRALAKCFVLDLSAIAAAKICGLNRNTTQRIYTLLRERIAAITTEEFKPFAGDIEVDESCFGPRRVRGKRGRGAAKKNSLASAFTSAASGCLSAWSKTALSKC